jgi:DNA recombination protein RmuC
MLVLIIIAAIVTGAAVAVLVLNNRHMTSRKQLETRFNDSERQCSVLTERIEQTLQQLKSNSEKLEQENRLVRELNAAVAMQRADNENLRTRLTEQAKELESVHERMKIEFENLSNRILDEKSKKFTEQNKNNLDIILNPLKEKIKDFEKKVDESYKAESAERNSLKGEIKSLVELNKQISDEANNLARALKGDTKKQGNWGEIILERILERSGLMRGSEYELQYSTVTDDGRRVQPDVVVFLPDNKHIVIDAKVSLIAYEAMCNAESDDDKARYLKEHLLSVRNHIKFLSDKNYLSAQGLTTLDFILIFMPIEPSFSIAVQEDTELFNYAWERKIVLVSPSTLLATLKTIGAIWKQEKQTRNALEIAKVGGALYDKFSNFLKDMLTIGEKIRSAQTSHEEALKKLSSGPGNIIRRIEEMKKLGAKTSKDIPVNLLEEAEENDANANL